MGTTFAFFAVVVAIFALAIAGLAIGVMLTGRCLPGSCGGPDVRGADGLSLRCLFCPNRRRRTGAKEEG